MPLSSELRLVSAACRRPAPDRETIAALAALSDNDTLVRLGRRHRVEALLRDGLRLSGHALTDREADFLDQAAAQTLADNLAQVAECARLQALFDDAGIPVLFIKGVTLATLAYGSLALKSSRDVDLLVSPETAIPTVALLEAASFTRLQPPPQIALVPGEAPPREIILRAQTGVLVEVHSRLLDNDAMLPGVGLGSTSRLVEVARGIALPTLADEPLFAYLCVHGAQHGWFRLKWLADLGALLSRIGPDQAPRLYEAAAALGAGRSAGQALLLCRALLALDLPERLIEELLKDRAHRRLVAMAYRILAVEGELDYHPGATAAMHLSHFSLRAGAAYKIQLLHEKAFRPGDRARLGLSPLLRPLYPVLALPLLALRRARRRRAESRR